MFSRVAVDVHYGTEINQNTECEEHAMYYYNP